MCNYPGKLPFLWLYYKNKHVLTALAFKAIWGKMFIYLKCVIEREKFSLKVYFKNYFYTDISF